MSVPVRYGPAQAWLPRPYSQLLRGPTFRWWRPLVSALVAVGALFVVLFVFWTGIATVMAATGGEEGLTEARLEEWSVSPSGVLFTNLMLAALILVGQAAVWAGFGWRPRWVSSVAGGVRWAWLVRCYLVCVALMVVANGVLVLIDGGMSIAPEQQAGLYAVVVLASTPLQAAGEEYLFRGWLSQAIGAWIPRAAVGAVVAAVCSGLVFAWAHGQQDPWLFLDRLVFGLIASWLVWRTGGLEASIALHGANNLLAFGLGVISGQVEATMTSTGADATMVAVDVLLLVLSAAVLDRLARRYAVARYFRPPVRAW
ncbi:MAG: CPBP family intramembrane glutamic endopeptidase [Kineosporiaceae bacterium]